MITLAILAFVAFTAWKIIGFKGMVLGVVALVLLSRGCSGDRRPEPFFPRCNHSCPKHCDHREQPFFDPFEQGEF